MGFRRDLGAFARMLDVSPQWSWGSATTNLTCVSLKFLAHTHRLALLATVLLLSQPAPPLPTSTTAQAAADLPARCPPPACRGTRPSLIPIEELIGDSSPSPPTPPTQMSYATRSAVPRRLAHRRQPATTAGPAAAPGHPFRGEGC